MRERKFRVFDSEEMIYFPNKTKDLVFTDKGPNILCFHRGIQLPLIERPNLKLMESTGLEDKNGKEIYEGDILMNTRKEYTTVNYLDEFAAFVRTGENHIISELVTQLLRDTDWDNWNIVGNIYENPELLENKSQES